MTLHDFQVLQRNHNDEAQITTDAGETVTLPVGGPYEVGGAKNVLVGDLWILAGQSNMEGVGDLIDVETPSPFVHSYQSREHWAVAEEPLHWLGESPQLVHHKLWGQDAVPDEPNPRDMGRTKGAGLGLTFGRLMHERTDVPVGLIPSAHGGTSMAQWDPALKSEGGGSLYGATLKRFEGVGSKVAGILWYQGESEASPADVAPYHDRMTHLVQSFREDFGQPDLPFYIVQIGCFVYPPSPEGIAGWNGIRDAQRTWAGTLPNTATVSAIDLGLDDGIHIGTTDFKRLAKRLADVASGHPAPDLRTVTIEANGTRLRVSFDNVRGGLRSQGRPAGFSLRSPDGTDLPLIYKTTLEGDSALLHLSNGDNPLPADTQLWYGWGLNPYCNVIDAEDAAIPAFGPITITTGL